MKTGQTPTVGIATLSPQAAPPPAPEEPPLNTRTITWQTAKRDFILQCYEDMAMERMRPRFEDFTKGMKPLVAVENIPNPRETSTTHPDNVDLVVETPGQEPTLGWLYFVRGCAAASLLVRREFYTGVKEMIRDAGERVIAGDTLPYLDGNFSVSVTRGERIIFCNGEHSSWRPMIAFMQGAYWVLSFIEKPTKRRGNYSPLEFVEGLVNHFGRAGIIPL